MDLEAIRARDAESYDIAYWPHIDRRALLAYVDALRAAAGKVECMCCAGGGRREIYERGDLIGEFPPIGDEPCPDCADLRKLLGERHE